MASNGSGRPFIVSARKRELGWFWVPSWLEGNPRNRPKKIHDDAMNPMSIQWLPGKRTPKTMENHHVSGQQTKSIIIKFNGTLWHIIIHYQKQTALPEGIPCSKAAPALLSPWALQDWCTSARAREEAKETERRQLLESGKNYYSYWNNYIAKLVIYKCKKYM